MVKDLYEAVSQNEYGFYMLKQQYRKSMADFYRNEYYQNNYGHYQHVPYDSLDMKQKQNFYSRKLTVFSRMSLKGKALSPREGQGTFLDIGCGEGFALAYFHAHGFEVTGIDYSSAGLEYHNPDMLKYLIQGDFTEIASTFAHQGRTFDFINLDNVLEHIPEPKKCLQCIKGICNKDSIVCITVPNDFSVIQKLAFDSKLIDDAFWVSTASSEHFNYFSVESLARLGESVGLIKRVALGDWPIDFFLLNPDSNYRQDERKGHNCHVACARLENRLSENSEEVLLNLYSALADAGIGREISVFFTLLNERTKLC